MPLNVRKMGEINIIQLINSIKVRPALYNKGDSMYYSHKKFKYKLWREVCQEVFRNWDCLAPHDKLEYARELQKRWKSLRSCFSREISLQKKEKLKKDKNEPFRRRKKYEYFKSLLFLLTPDKIEEYNVDSDTDEDPLESNTTTDEYCMMDVLDPDSDQEVEEERRSTVRKSDKFNASPSSQIKLEPSFIEPIELQRALADKSDDNASVDNRRCADQPVDGLREIRLLENDDDRMFALSLVPIFKNLSMKKKMDARIEVLQLLRSITYRNDDTDQ